MRNSRNPINEDHYFVRSVVSRRIQENSGLPGSPVCSWKYGFAGEGRKMAVIGARKTDEVGNDAAYRLGRMYAKQGYTVVSGLVISEQSLGVKANPSRLVARNRLQAALSDFVVVAQCPAKSGTLYTVDFALEYGEPVFAVDFGFHDEINAGNWQLLSQGVQPIFYSYLNHNLA